MFGACRRVEIAAGRLDLLGDIACRATPRALERHMFEKMRQAMLVGSFVARSSADKTPSEAVSRCAMRSVAILRPEGKVVISTLMRQSVLPRALRGRE